MPIYEYACRSCGHAFERLVLPPATTAEVAPCPSCQSSDLERVPSRLSVSSDSTRQLNVQRARKLGTREAREKEVADLEVVTHHTD